jgi:hypothetical protein
MKKFGIFLLTLLLAILIAGLYGILHDQVTYTISREYFTKFKFVQFGLADEDLAPQLPEPRRAVAVVGFLATWWTGIFIGIGLGLADLSFREPRTMLRYILRAIGLVLAITLVAGVVGGFYGRFYLFKTGVDWWLPDNLINKRDFITVGSIHNFSYLGGLLGLLTGIFYLGTKSRKRKKYNFPT